MRALNLCRLVKPIEGGGQSHYCILPKGHEEQEHRCPCSHEWVAQPQPVEVTAEQWVDRFLALSREQQVKKAERVLQWAAEAARCFTADHESAVERLRSFELGLQQVQQ